MRTLLRFAGPVLLILAVLAVAIPACGFFPSRPLVVPPPQIPVTWRAIFHSGEGTKTIDFKAQSIRLYSGGVDVCVEFVTDGRTEGAVCGLVAVGRPE